VVERGQLGQGIRALRGGQGLTGLSKRARHLVITAFLLGPLVILVILFYVIIWTLDAQASKPSRPLPPMNQGAGSHR
jgi:hypothetical protein